MIRFFEHMAILIGLLVFPWKMLRYREPRRSK